MPLLACSGTCVRLDGGGLWSVNSDHDRKVLESCRHLEKLVHSLFGRPTYHAKLSDTNSTLLCLKNNEHEMHLEWVEKS